MGRAKKPGGGKGGEGDQREREQGIAATMIAPGRNRLPGGVSKIKEIHRKKEASIGREEVSKR